MRNKLITRALVIAGSAMLALSGGAAVAVTSGEGVSAPLANTTFVETAAETAVKSTNTDAPTQSASAPMTAQSHSQRSEPSIEAGASLHANDDLIDGLRIGFTPPSGESLLQSSESRYDQRSINVNFTGSNSDALPADETRIILTYDTRAISDFTARDAVKDDDEYVFIGTYPDDRPNFKQAHFRLKKPLPNGDTVTMGVMPRPAYGSGVPNSVKSAVTAHVEVSGRRVSEIAQSIYESHTKSKCLDFRASDHGTHYVSDYDTEKVGTSTILSRDSRPETRNRVAYRTRYSLDNRRSIDKINASFDLIEYDAIDESGTRVKRYPTLVSAESPGWSQSIDGSTISYDSLDDASGDFTIGEFGALVKGLVLAYPGRILGDKSWESSKIMLGRDYQSPISAIVEYVKLNDYPEERPIEYVETCSENGLTISNSARPFGSKFEKRASVLLEGQRRRVSPGSLGLINTLKARSNDQVRWSLVYSKTADAKPGEIVLSDHDLDPRLRYHSVLRDSGTPDAVITGYDSDGNAIYSLDYKGVPQGQSGYDDRYEIPLDVSEKISRMTISFDGDSVGDKTVIFNLASVLRNPSQTLGKPESLCNSATLESDVVMNNQNNKTSRACLEIKEPKRYYEVRKQSEPAPNTTLAPGSGLTYFLDATTIYDDDLDDGLGAVTMIDVLPEGLILDEQNPVTLEPEFKELGNASYEIVEDYRGSGKTAIVITGGPMKKSDKTRVARVHATVDPDAVQVNRITNEVYLRIDGAGPRIKSVSDGSVVEKGDWSKSSITHNVSVNRSLRQSKAIREYDQNGDPGPWRGNQDSTPVVTDPGARIDYRVRIVNGHERSFGGLEIYDVFPHNGDRAISGNPNGNNSRGSSFSNTYDRDRTPTIPPGYQIHYYNGPVSATYHDGTQVDAHRVMRSLQWDDTPSESVSAVRITQDPGVRLQGLSSEEFVLPFIAGNDSVIDHEYGGLSIDPSSFARNSAYYRVDELTDVHGDPQAGLIEGVAVRNTLKHTPIKIVIHKKDTEGSPLQDAEFALQNEKGETVLTATSDENGLVEFTEPKPKGGWKIVETRAPDTYVKSSQEITLSSEQIKNARLNNGGVLDLGEFVNTQDPVRFPLTLPMTGDNPVLTLLVGSGLILLGGSALYLWMNRARIFSTNGGDRSKKH